MMKPYRTTQPPYRTMCHQRASYGERSFVCPEQKKGKNFDLSLAVTYQLVPALRKTLH